MLPFCLLLEKRGQRIWSQPFCTNTVFKPN